MEIGRRELLAGAVTLSLAKLSSSLAAGPPGDEMPVSTDRAGIHMTLVEDWLRFTDKLLEAGVHVISAGVFDLRDESRADPKVISLLLLARTLCEGR